MGYRFSLVLSREVTEEESAVLRAAGCESAVFGTDIHPTNTEITVTKMDFDDTMSPTLAEAIESALEAVKNVDVPDLTIPGLTVPAQPAGPVTEDSGVVQGEVIDETGSAESDSAEAVVAANGTVTAPQAEVADAASPTPGAKKAPAKRAVAKKATARKNGTAPKAEPVSS
jgi:hypothetical protein